MKIMMRVEISESHRKFLKKGTQDFYYGVFENIDLSVNEMTLLGYLMKKKGKYSIMDIYRGIRYIGSWNSVEAGLKRLCDAGIINRERSKRLKYKPYIYWFDRGNIIANHRTE